MIIFNMGIIFRLFMLNKHHVLRIDNGGLGYMCTRFCIVSDILAIHKSI